jgi:hypothetical protein
MGKKVLHHWSQRDENDQMRARLRELEAQTVQLIEEKRSVELNLDEVKQQLEAAAAAPPAPPEPVEVDQVTIL